MREGRVGIILPLSRPKARTGEKKKIIKLDSGPWSAQRQPLFLFTQRPTEASGVPAWTPLSIYLVPSVGSPSHPKTQEWSVPIPSPAPQGSADSVAQGFPFSLSP